MEEYKITNLILSPANLAYLLDSKKFLSSKNESLTDFLLIGAIVQNVLRTKFESIFPDRNMTIFYGMTEIGICFTTPGEYKVQGSVGSSINPGTQVKIIDDDGNALENGKVGEICGKNSYKFIVS